MPTVTIFWIDSAVSCPTVRLHFCMGVYDKSLIIEITRRRYRHGDEPALDRLQGAAKSSKNRGWSFWIKGWVIRESEERPSYPYTEQNQSNIALGNPGSWSFALDGSGVIQGLAAAVDSDADGVGDFPGGVVLVQSDLEGISYTATAWNNDDRASGGTPTSDTDGRIMIRTVALGPRGATCTIESLIEGTTDSGGIDGYKAQAGAGAGKSYSNNDLVSISDFSQQM